MRLLVVNINIQANAFNACISRFEGEGLLHLVLNLHDQLLDGTAV